MDNQNPSVTVGGDNEISSNSNSSIFSNQIFLVFLFFVGAALLVIIIILFIRCVRIFNAGQTYENQSMQMWLST